MKTTSTLLAILLLGCGGSTTSTQSTQPAPLESRASESDSSPAKRTDTATTPTDAELVEGTCKALFAAHEREACSLIVKTKLTFDQCRATFADSLASAKGELRGAFVEALTCTSRIVKCEEMAACMRPVVAMMDDDHTCGDGKAGPLALNADMAAKRHGLGADKFSAVASTRERPVEVCGLQGELTWLTRVQCDDGSNPFPDLDKAHESRAGSVGSGGQCGHIIDLYEVPCPEKTYDVYMDMYMCGPGEGL